MKKILIFLFIASLVIGQTRTKDITVTRGDDQTEEFKVTGDFSSGYAVYFTVKASKTLTASRLIALDTSDMTITYSAPKTTFEITIPGDSTRDFTSLVYYYDLSVENISTSATSTPYSGEFRMYQDVRTPYDDTDSLTDNSVRYIPVLASSIDTLEYIKKVGNTYVGDSLFVNDMWDLDDTLNTYSNTAQVKRLIADSTILTNIEGLQDSLNLMVNYTDSNTVFTSPTQVSDSLAATLAADKTVSGAWDFTEQQTISSDSLFSLKVNSGGIYVGTLALETGDSAMYLSKELVTNHAHYGFFERSTLNYSIGGIVGHASFNARSVTTGTTDSDHQHSYQDTQRHEGSGTIDKVVGFFTNPVFLGAVNKFYGFKSLVAGGNGTVGEYYDYWANGSNTRGVVNYAYYSDGSAPSKFGGALIVATDNYFNTDSAKIAGLIYSDGTYMGINQPAPRSGLEIRNNDIYFSNSSIAHGLTGIQPTDVGGRINTGTNGALTLAGISDADDIGMALSGIIGIADPTDSTPAVRLRGGKSDGSTGWQALGNSEIILQVQNYTTPEFTIYGNGTLGFSNGGTLFNTDANNLAITEANVNIVGNLNSSSGLDVTGSITGSTTFSLGSSGGTSAQITGIASDNDQSTITWGTSDQITIGNATGGVFLDNGDLYLSDDNISHGLTGIRATNIGGGLATGANGGLGLDGISDADDVGIWLTAIIGVADPTDSTPAIRLRGGKSNGSTAWQALGASEIVFEVQNYTTPEFTVYGNGDIKSVGDATISGGDINGATDGKVQINADTDLYIDLDSDNDGSNTLYVRSGADANVLTVDESGNTTQAGNAIIQGADGITLQKSGSNTYYLDPANGSDQPTFYMDSGDSRTLYITNAGAGTLGLNVEGNATVEGTIDAASLDFTDVTTDSTTVSAGYVYVTASGIVRVKQ